MEKNKKKDSYSASDDTLQDVSGGYLVEGTNYITAYDSETNRPVARGRKNPNDPEYNDSLRDTMNFDDVKYHQKKYK